jgi:hypothetical protein
MPVLNRLLKLVDPSEITSTLARQILDGVHV